MDQWRDPPSKSGMVQTYPWVHLSSLIGREGGISFFVIQTKIESRKGSIGEQQTSDGKWILELFHELPSYACCEVAL